jgi:hypothetical protein
MDMDICTPAKFYLFFAVLSFLTAMFYGQSSLFIIVQIIVSVAWVFGLNFLCKSGYMTIAWAITLIPVWISIILYGLTFIPINGSGGTSVNGTFAPVPGDFSRLKAATLTDIINSIFRQFTSQAQIAIKPVFDQAKCNAAKAAVPTGWGNRQWNKTDNNSPYYQDPVISGMTDAVSTISSGSSAGYCPNNYSTTSAWGVESASSSASCTAGAANSYHRPPKLLWEAQVAAC